MILLQNPNIPTSVNPVEIDSAIIDIKSELEVLPWLTNGYGRAFKNLDITNGERVYFPEIYLGKQNGSYRYTNISPDNDKQGQCFFYVRRETISEYQTGMYSFLNYDVAVIFSVNMELIDATLTGTEVFQQVLVAQVRDILTRQILGKPYVLKVKTVEFNFEDVFREFKMSEQSTMEKSPLSHFRFNISVAMQESCPVPTIIPPVTTCYSLDFDGVNEKIDCTNNVIYNLERTDSFTISSWFYADLLGVGQFNALMIKYDNSLDRGYLLGFKDGKLKFSLQHNGGANGIMVNTINSINAGEWYNVTATYNGTSLANGLTVYVNGIIQAVSIAFDNLTTTVTNTIPLTIAGSDVFFFNGKIASSRMWDTELTPVQIVAEYNSGTILSPAVQGVNLVLDTDINNATFGTEWNIPDLTGITAGYESVNMELEDKISDCPS